MHFLIPGIIIANQARLEYAKLRACVAYVPVCLRVFASQLRVFLFLCAFSFSRALRAFIFLRTLRTVLRGFIFLLALDALIFLLA